MIMLQEVSMPLWAFILIVSAPFLVMIIRFLIGNKYQKQPIQKKRKVWLVMTGIYIIALFVISIFAPDVVRDMLNNVGMIILLSMPLGMFILSFFVKSFDNSRE